MMIRKLNATAKASVPVAAMTVVKPSPTKPAITAPASVHISSKGGAAPLTKARIASERSLPGIPKPKDAFPLCMDAFVGPIVRISVIKFSKTFCV